MKKTGEVASKISPQQGDPSELKRTEGERVGHHYAETILRAVPVPLLVLHPDLRVNTASEAFYATFRVAPAATEGRLVYEIGTGEWGIPQLRELLEEIIPRDNFFNGFEVTHEFPTLGRRTLLLNARRTDNAEGMPEHILLAIEDITERKRTADALAAAEAFSRSVLESSPDCLKLLDREGRMQFMNANGQCLLEIDDFAPMHGQLWSSLWPAETAGVVTEAIAKACRGEAARFRAEAPTAKGRMKWWDVIVAPITAGGGSGPEGALISVSRDVTELRAIEQALRASEQRSRTLFDAAPMAIFVCDRDAVIQTYNQRAVELWGRAPVCGVEKHCGSTKLILPDGALLPHTQSPMVEVLRTGIPARNVEVFIERPDGSRVLVLVNFVALRDAQGDITGAITSFVDISDRKQAEAATRHSEENYRLLVEGATGFAIIRLELDGRVSMWNVGAERMLGYRDEEILGQHFTIFFTPEDQAAGRPERELATARAVEKGDDDNWLVRKDGSRFWASGATTALRDEAGNLRGYAKIVRDMSTRREADERLRASESRKSAILEGALDGIITMDHEGKVVDFNPAAEAMFGIRREEIVGQVMAEKLIPERLRSRHDAGLAHYLDTEEGPVLKQRIEVPALHAKGHEFTIELSINRIPEVEPPMFTATLRDITERKNGEEALRRAVDVAERASRAKDDFLAALSHELRTPLTPVLLAAADLRDDGRLPADLREQLSMMERNIALEARLIDDLLDLTSITRGKLQLRPQRCDTHALIGLAIAIVQPEASAKEITLARMLDAPHSGLVADPARFQQVIWNLLRNAVKFTPHGGRISIRTRDEKTPGGARWLRIEVVDSGIGIDPAQVDNIFAPFDQGGLTGDHRYGGLGLGLAIARSVVELHGGRISAHSEGTDRGATFVVELPGAIDARSSAPPTDNPFVAGASFPLKPLAQPAAPAAALRLLLVEDHESTLRTLSFLLRRDGHRLTTAATLAAAFAAAAAEQFDLVISDLGLPDGTGNELMEKLRSDYGLRGVALSGYGMEEDLARSRAAGFVAHLVKPIQIAELRRVIAALTPDK